MTVGDFEQHRQFLIGVAYRMLGSLAEAEDIVQDAFLRWSTVDEVVDNPRAYLAQIVSRLCLDRMKSAAVRREQYVGTWLPEPLVAPENTPPVADDLSLALLFTLERLSPLERAAFLLHDVFDMDYAVIATTLERSESACRQLAARGREHVREGRPRFTASRETTAKLADAFAAALTEGRLDDLAQLLAEDAVVYTDGGGKRHAALNPIYGREKIVRFLVGVTRKSMDGPVLRVERVLINGLPGFLIWTGEGPETMSFAVEDDRIVGIYAVRNPDKLRHLS